MARKENRACNTENSIFAIRFREQIEAKGLNQTKLADKIKREQGYILQRQTIAQYMSGLSKPDTERLTVLCKALDVSADYLLGLSNENTENKNLQEICNYTGLSKEFVTYVAGLPENRLGISKKFRKEYLYRVLAPTKVHLVAVLLESFDTDVKYARKKLEEAFPEIDKIHFWTETDSSGESHRFADGANLKLLEQVGARHNKIKYQRFEISEKILSMFDQFVSFNEYCDRYEEFEERYARTLFEREQDHAKE